jgi:hypothetical protein
LINKNIQKVSPLISNDLKTYFQSITTLVPLQSTYRGSGPKMGYVGKTGYQCLTRNESWQLLVLAPNACVWTLVLVVCCQKCDPLVF